MSYVWGLKVNKDSFIAHERYDVSTSTNNIGLVYLTSEIPKNDHIILISLPTRAEAYENLDEKTGTIIGFGKNSDEANSISTLLRWVEVSIIRNDECYSLLGTKISESNFCAEITSGRKACYGLLN